MKQQKALPKCWATQNLYPKILGIGIGWGIGVEWGIQTPKASSTAIFNGQQTGCMEPVHQDTHRKQWW